jgi:hypothetical protein
LFEQLLKHVAVVFAVKTSFATHGNLIRMLLSAIISGVWMCRVQTAEHYTGSLRNMRQAVSVILSLEHAVRKVEFVYQHWKPHLSLSALS